MSLLLVGFLLALAAAFFWAGFRSTPHPLQYRSQAGFVVTLVLACFAGFFAWRESQALADLAAFIDPVPDGFSPAPRPTDSGVGPR